MKKGDLLFVYGTLRRGQRANGVLDKSPYEGGDVINGMIYDLGSFPGLKAEPGHFCPGSPSVTGDVYEIPDDETVKVLDGYEGYPDLYTRMQTETVSGRIVWVYVFNQDVNYLKRIVGGDWCKHAERVCPRIDTSG